MRYRFSIIVIAFFIPASLSAYVMGSSSYRMNADSINFGGAAASSASYRGDDTMGEIGSGTSSSATYSMNAGYQQMQQSYISISSSNDSALPNLNGLSGGAATATTTWTVITDNAAGYSLTVQSATSPALTGPNGASFADYTPSTADPDYTFSFTTSQSLFGFSPEGNDVSARFRDNGAICNTGGLETSDTCWDGLSTTPKIVATGATSNHPSGATTTIKYRAAIGSAKIQDSGAYSTTVTVTATTL